MIVFRCENENNKGPFWVNGPFLSKRRELLDHFQSDDNFPTPYEEGIDRRETDYCGFQDIEKLQKWFTKREREALRKFGWKFYALEVDKARVKLGKRQCVFRRDAAKIIKELHEDDISNWKPNGLDEKGMEARSAKLSG